MSFKSVRGQERVGERLRSSLEKNHLAHALLFVGDEGTGRRQMARELAKSLFCRDKSGIDACEECASCRQVEAGSHPDFHVLAPEEDSRVIKIEETRALISSANFKPFQAPCKVFVIERADCLNEVAQNALLKTLEEPEGRTYFVLITAAPDLLLSTLKSRLQAFTFMPVDTDKEIDAERESLERQAVEFILFSAAADRALFGGAASAPELGKADRETLRQLMDDLTAFFRDALLFRAGAGEMVLPSSNRADREKLAAALSEDALERSIELFGETKDRLAANLNLKLVVQALWDDFDKIRETTAR